MAMTIEGKVAEILDKHTLVANIGNEDGVEEGMNFLVYEKGKIVRDPDTNEKLGRAPSVEKAEVTSTEVLENMTVMKTKAEAKTVPATPTNLNLNRLFGKKTITDRDELKTDKPVPDDRSIIQKGDRVRRIESNDDDDNSDAKTAGSGEPE